MSVDESTAAAPGEGAGGEEPEGLSICVFCASSTRVEPTHLDVAAALGAEMANRGHTLVSGGGSVGSMGAVAVACRAAGGRTVGVIPEALAESEVADRDADELVLTRDLRERKAVMDARSDAFIALPGGLGTLEELLEVWTLRGLGLLSKPVVVCDPTGVLAPLERLVDNLAAQGFVRPRGLTGVRWTRDVVEALDMVEKLAAEEPETPVSSMDEWLEAEP